MRLSPLIGAALLVLACATRTGTSDTDVPLENGDDGSAVETEVSAPAPACLGEGGTAVIVFADLQVTPGGGGYCSTPAAVSGYVRPVPSGGWIVTGGTEPCCTDTAVSRLVRVSAEGLVLWSWEESGNTMGGLPGLPSLLSVRPEGFLIERARGPSYPPTDVSVELVRDDRSSAWALDAEALGFPGQLFALPSPAGSSDAWFLASFDDPGDPRHGLLRITADGSADLVAEAADARGTLAATAMEPAGITLLVEQDTRDAGTGRAALRVARLSFDGAAGGIPVEVGTWETRAEGGLFHVQAREVAPGFLADVTWTDTGPIGVQHLETLRIDLDGKVVWRHAGPWTTPGGEGWMLGSFHAEADGSIGVLGIERTLEEREFVYRARISPDGQDLEILDPDLPEPLASGAPWWPGEVYAVGTGFVVLALVQTADPENPILPVLAGYDAGFETLRWAVPGGEPVRGASLGRDGDAWLLTSWKTASWPECLGFGANATSTILRRFERLCSAQVP